MIGILVIVGITVSIVFYGIGTIMPLGQAMQVRAGRTTFDARVYVESIWDSRVIPTILEKAMDVQFLLAEIDRDPEKASHTYGNQVATEGSYSFMVKGKGKVMSVENGALLRVDLTPYDGVPDVSIRIGPPFTGTELRDAVGFIKFTGFRNILEYAAVANELNARVRETVGKKIDFETILGKSVSFYGAFTLHERNDIVIIPVKLEVGGKI